MDRDVPVEHWSGKRRPANGRTHECPPWVPVEALHQFIDTAPGIQG